MLKRLLVFVGVAFLAVALSGCATVCKKSELESQGLKNQVSVLEAQIQSKDQEIAGLKDELSKSNEQKIQTTETVNKSAVDLKMRPTVKQVQIALKNAGYEPGKIDGNMGKQTRDAIKAFQKAHNLTVNGKANKKTWALLGEYLGKKEK